jgi:hypothetical protein
MYAVDYKGYFDYGNPDSDVFLDEIAGVGALQQQWFPAAREFLAKQQPELLQQIADLTNTSLPKQYHNVYATWVGDMGMFFNLARLAMMNGEFSELTKYFPQYMGRMTRCWRRGSTLPAYSYVREDALALGTIPFWPGVSAPVLRFYQLLYGPSEYGPITLDEIFTAHSETLEPTDDPIEILSSNIKLGRFVEWLEEMEGWLERGDSNIRTDFYAMKDMLNRIAGNAVTGSSVGRGLPPADAFPGLLPSKAAFTEFLSRHIAWKEKVSVGTDQWYMSPVVNANLQGYIPVIGLGVPTLYDYVCIGVPKFGVFTGGTDPVMDVNTAFYVDGTRHRIACHFEDGARDVREIFGSPAATTHADEVYLRAGTSIADRIKVYYETATADLANLVKPARTFAQHVASLQALERVHWAQTLSEMDQDYMMLLTPQHMAEDTLQILMQRFKLPTLRWTQASGGD